MIDIALTSFCSYSVAYFSLKYFGKIKYFKKTKEGMKEFTEKDYTYTNILHVSLIHAMVCIVLGFGGLIFYDHDIWRPMNKLEEIAIGQSIAYMIYDTLAHYFNGYLDFFIIWHHLGWIATILIFWWDGHGLWILMHNMSVGEITHPFHITQIIFSMKNEPKDSTRYKANLLAFTSLFIPIRFLLWSIVNYPVMVLKSYSISKKLIVIPCLALNIDWSIQAFLKACKVLLVQKEKETNKLKGSFHKIENLINYMYKTIDSLKDNTVYKYSKLSILFVIPGAISLIFSYT